eukprot:1181438-Prorocentrum_minimum.AAC.2
MLASSQTVEESKRTTPAATRQQYLQRDLSNPIEMLGVSHQTRSGNVRHFVVRKPKGSTALAHQ